MGTRVHARVGNASSDGSQQGAQRRGDNTGAYCKGHRRRGMTGRHGRTDRLGVHETKDGQMLGQRSGPGGQRRFEDQVCNPGGNTQGKEAVQCCLRGFPGKVAMIPAIPNQSLPLVAAAESSRKNTS